MIGFPQWKDDPVEQEKLMLLDFMIPAMNRFAPDEAMKVSLQEMLDFIDEWSKEHLR